MGQYYDNYYKCIAVFEEEEKRAKTQVYKGDASLGKRALQRVLMKKQLEQMGIELRELMIYQSPPELGALYTEVEEMMKQMGKEQKVLIAAQIKKEHAEKVKREKRLQKLRIEAMWGFGIVFIIFVTWWLFALIIDDRIKKYPHLGDGWIPKTEAQRKRESEPQIYVGR